MNAKQVLERRVRALTEDEAESWLELLELFDPVPRAPVSAPEREAALRAVARLDAGERVPWSDVKRSLSLEG